MANQIFLTHSEMRWQEESGYSQGDVHSPEGALSSEVRQAAYLNMRFHLRCFALVLFEFT